MLKYSCTEGDSGQNLRCMNTIRKHCNKHAKGRDIINKADRYIEKEIRSILRYGFKDENPRPKYADGTPAHTLSLNQIVRQYDLNYDEFPITTLRPIAWKSAIKEILWIYQDRSNDLNVLRDKYGIRYWDSWESKDEPGTIGRRYGYVVRKYDLMNKLLDGLKNDPYGRRHIIDLYQYKELDESDGLHPCAFCSIWNVRKGLDGKIYLDMTLIQRSGDLMAASCAGVNEIQYTALMMMVARHCGYKVGNFMHWVGNEQIYDRHIDQANEMLKRAKTLKNVLRNEPRLILKSDKTNFYDFTIDDFEMVDYHPIQPQLKFELGI